MGDEDKTTKTEDTQVDPQELAKSLDSTIKELNTLIKAGSTNTETLNKSEGDVDTTTTPEKNDDDEGEVNKAVQRGASKGVFDQGRLGSAAKRAVETYGKRVGTVEIRKSDKSGEELVEEVINQGKDGAAEAIDVSDFMYGLAKGIQVYLDDQNAQIAQKVDGLNKIAKSISDTLALHSKILVANSEMNKSLSTNVMKLGEGVDPSNSLLKSLNSGGRFELAGVDLKKAAETKAEILQKSSQAVLEDKIDITLSSMIEERAHAGLPLENDWRVKIGLDKE